MVRKFLVPLLILALLIAGGLVLWSWRVPIARDFVDSALEKRGVQGSYDIVEIGFRRQRLENIVMGDPKSPDLTAEWAEIHFGLSGIAPSIRLIRANGVRLKGRLVDGKLSLGAIDRLMPPPSDKPFELPDLAVDISDAELDLATQAGSVRLALVGKGNLADGFVGQLAMSAPMLDFGGCRIERSRALFNLGVEDRSPALDGPLRAASLACGETRIASPGGNLDVAFGAGLDSWNGGLMLGTGRVGLPGASIAATGGQIAFKGDADSSDAQLDLALRDLRSAGLQSFAGLDGTPVGPLARALEKATRSASRRLTVGAKLHLAGSRLTIAPLTVKSASGASFAFQASGDRGIRIDPHKPLHIDGEASLSGGGFPSMTARLRSAGAGFAGVATMQPYAAGGARLAVDSVRFGQGRVATRVVMDGPLGDGRVDGLSLPIDGRFAANGAILLNPGCSPLAFRRLSIVGAAFGPTKLPLCATGPALFARSATGVISGGARITLPRLVGRLGDSPLLISAARAEAGFARPGFRLDNLAVRLGEGADPTRLAVKQLDGAVAGEGVSGRFAGAGGKIGAVPLVMSQADGRWRVAGGVLSLGGDLALADASADPRFSQLVSRDFTLALEDGVLRGEGSLRHPRIDTTVTRVTLRHDLSSAAGEALLDVPGLTFTPELQPEMLTRLTLGIIANVRGTVTGQGRIAWNGRGVTSSGDFATDSLDLAAAFGPVKGLAGKIHFSDLLALATPPGQVVTLAEVNPGVAVEDGVIRYQLLPDQVMKIEEGRWPFSGGELTLDPAVLDFGKPSERRLTFRVVGMDAARFVQQFEFKNIAVTGVFDGLLPMIFDAGGGRIEGGRLVVRRGGGTLAYVGEISNADLGRFGSMAFDALKSIRYDRLAIELNGSLDGEIVSRVIFNGVNEAPVDAGKGPIQGLTGLPFRFNITITAPFRSLINSAQAINDPRGLVRDTLEQRRSQQTVQPKESGTMP